MKNYKKDNVSNTNSNSIRVEMVKDDPSKADLYKNDRYLGRLERSNGGVFITKRREIFRKYNGFGINVALLESNIDFNTVIVEYKDLYFKTPRQKFITEGELYSFDRGADSKLFLPTTAFKVEHELEIAA